MRGFLCAIFAVVGLGGGAQAGQGFSVTVTSEGVPDFPTTQVSTIQFKNWYLKEIRYAQQYPGGQPSIPFYTEQCAAFLGCTPPANGNRNYPFDEVHVMAGTITERVFKYCIIQSDGEPISDFCGESDFAFGASKVYDDEWYAGCIIMKSATQPYECAVEIKEESSGDIAITYTLSLPE